MGVKISAIGCYKPKVYVSNGIWQEKFAPPVEISGQEFVRMIMEGIVERYYASPEETVVSMSQKAIRHCLSKCHVGVEDIDLLIHASNVSDEISGDCAKIQEAVGATNALTYELTDVACTGFMIPLIHATRFIESGLYNHVLISCVGNAATRGGNMADLLACGLGELATATLLSRCEGDSGFLACSHKTFGEFAEVFQFMPVSYGVMVWPRSHKDKYWSDLYHIIPARSLPDMERITSQYTSAIIQETLNNAHLASSDIQWFITHQAGGLLKRWRELCGIDKKRHLDTFGEVGNSSMSNIPYTMMRAMEEGKFSPGDKILLFSPGTGVHLTSAVWKW